MNAPAVSPEHFLLAALATCTVVLSAACGPDRFESGSVAIRSAEVARDADSPALVTGVTDDDPRIRARAAVALGRIQDPGSAKPLADLSDDPDPAVASAALFALGQLGLHSGGRALPVAVEACARHADVGDPDLVARAVECLGKQAPDDGPARIDMAFGHPDGNVRVEAAHAAMRLRFAPVWRGQTDTPPAWPAALVDRLAELLADPEVAVRRAAAHAFSRYGDPRGTAALGGALDDPDPQVRLFAARALGRGGDRTAIARLESACADPDAGVRTEAVARLDALEAAARVPAALADDPSFHVRASFAASLASRPDGAARAVALLSDPSSTVVAAAAITLAAIDPDGAEAHLEALAADPRWPVRAACATAAGRIGPSGLAILELLARDGQAAVRAAAIEATAASVETREARAIVERGLAASTLAERGSAVARVAESSWDDRLAVLRSAFEAAAGVDGIELRETIVDATADDPAAAGLLERAAEDPAPSVRARARAALGLERDGRGSTPREPPFGPWTSGEAPIVVLDTDRGTIEIRTLPDVAPYHVANLVALVRSKGYDGLPWHRVVSNFVVQGGDPEGTGWGGPGWTLPDEISPVRFERGVLGMPKAGKDTGGCQLFLTHIPTPHLDGNYTVFGEVVSGVEVLDRIEVGDRIRTARIAGDPAD